MWGIHKPKIQKNYAKHDKKVASFLLLGHEVLHYNIMGVPFISHPAIFVLSLPVVLQFLLPVGQGQCHVMVLLAVGVAAVWVQLLVELCLSKNCGIEPHTAVQMDRLEEYKADSTCNKVVTTLLHDCYNLVTTFIQCSTVIRSPSTRSNRKLGKGTGNYY